MLMNTIFSLHISKFVIVFLDDILIYSRSWDEHLEQLRIVLDTLRQHQLFAKLSKCSFAQSSISYLSHIISSEGVATDPEKMRAMEEWPRPTTVTELRGFLGLTGYYRKFVKNYGIIAKPLTQLLTKKGFLWSVYEKEFLAVIMAIDKWRQYLQRGPFAIVTDHKSLCHLQEQQLTSDLQRKATAKMLGLQFHFKYRKGSENSAADALCPG